MGEHLTADSVMTPDGEVMPLGPVDKEGRKVSLSTATLFADSGMECTVKRFWSASPWNWLTLLKTINTAVHAATFIRTTKIITVTTVSGAPPAAIPSRIVRTIG